MLSRVTIAFRDHSKATAIINRLQQAVTKTSSSSGSISLSRTVGGQACSIWSRASVIAQLPRKSGTAFPAGFWQARSRSYYSSSNYGYQRPSDPQRVIWGLIGLNVAGFMVWRVDPRFMSRHATVSYSALAEGRVWTLVTAAFSHYDPWHLAANMFTFYFFASTIPHLYGGTALVGLYLTGAVVGNLAHVVWSAMSASQGMPRGGGRMSEYGIEARRRASSPALGASGAVNAVVIAQICLFPSSTILLYGILPMPSALFGLLWIASDIGGMLGGGGSRTSFSGHLGGATCGVGFWYLARRGFFRR